MKEYNGKQSVQFEKKNGKYILEFDDIPSLLSVSYDGCGTTDQIFYNGEFIDNAKSVTIRSKVRNLTEYEVTAYALVFKDGGEMNVQTETKREADRRHRISIVT